MARPWRADSCPRPPQRMAPIRGHHPPGTEGSGSLCARPRLLVPFPVSHLPPSVPRSLRFRGGSRLCPMPGAPSSQLRGFPCRQGQTTRHRPSSFLPKPGSRRGSENSSEVSGLRRGPYRRAKVRPVSRPHSHGCSPCGQSRPPAAPSHPARAVGPSLPQGRGSLPSGK